MPLYIPAVMSAVMSASTFAVAQQVQRPVDATPHVPRVLRGPTIERELPATRAASVVGAHDAVQPLQLRRQVAERVARRELQTRR